MTGTKNESTTLAQASHPPVGEQVMTDRSPSSKSLPAGWSAAVEQLLQDWHGRMAAAEEAHFHIADSYGKAAYRLGLPVVILSAVAGTSVFATLGEQVGTAPRVVVGIFTLGSAILGSIQTFLKYDERTQKHTAAAVRFEDLRREIASKLNVPREYRGDAAEYLEDLRVRVDLVAKGSPRIGERGWRRARRLFKLAHKEATPSARRARPEQRSWTG